MIPFDSAPGGADIARQIVALPGFEWEPGMEWAAGFGWCRVKPHRGLTGTLGAVINLDDPATGGILLHKLGTEAWRVRYSPSMHKQSAGTPWIVDLPAVGVDSRQRVYPSLGRACAAVLVALAEHLLPTTDWSGNYAEPAKRVTE